MALDRVKAYWAEMDATTVAAQGSAIGRVAAEHYFEEVLGGCSFDRGPVLEEYYV